MARVRLANQLLAALTPGKAARGTRRGKGREKGKRKERETSTNLVWRQGDGRRKEKKSKEGVHPSAGLQFFQLKLFILALGWILAADTSSAGLGEEVQYWLQAIIRVPDVRQHMRAIHDATSSTTYLLHKVSGAMMRS